MATKGRKKNLTLFGKREKLPTRRAERAALKHSGLDLDAIEEGRRREKEEKLGALLARKQRNPGHKEKDAAALSEAFHGRPARSARTVEEKVDEPDTLTDLGRLVQLEVLIDEAHLATLSFSAGVRVASTPDGGSLYFVGGDQSLNLARLALGKYLPKDHITIGQVQKIVYATSKAFHNFEPCEYEHEFAEEGGELPVLGYDTRSRKLYLTGGSYHVAPEGIRN